MRKIRELVGADPFEVPEKAEAELFARWMQVGMLYPLMRGHSALTTAQHGYDWWSGEAFEGSTHILAYATLEQMPLYLRAGSIIPMASVMQYVDKQPLDQLRLRVCMGTGEFTFYEDDGHSFEYKTGVFCKTTYRVRSEGQQTLVEIGSREGSFLPVARKTIVELVSVGEQRFVDDGTARQLTFSTFSIDKQKS